MLSLLLAHLYTHASIKINSRSFRYASPHLWNQHPHSLGQPHLDLPKCGLQFWSPQFTHWSAAVVGNIPQITRTPVRKSAGLVRQCGHTENGIEMTSVGPRNKIFALYIMRTLTAVKFHAKLE